MGLQYSTFELQQAMQEMPRSWLFITLLSLYVLDPLLSVCAVPTNRTIDDSLGDSVTGAKPIYQPSIAAGVWDDQTCPTAKCAIVPSTQSAFKGTWTAATYLPDLGSISIELDFKGTAIYVYFILANNVAPGVTTGTACNFTLDGSHAGSFSHTPTSSSQFQYNALVFSTNNLQNSDHKLIIETSGVDHDVFVNFDYAIYTTEDTVVDASATPLGSTSTASSPSTPGTSTPGSTATTSSSLDSVSTSSGSTSPTSSTSTNIPGGSNNDGGGSTNSPSTTNNSNASNGASQSSKTNVAAIVGGAVGGVAVLSVAILGLLFCLRRRRKQFELGNDFPSNNNTPALVNPFDDLRPSNSGRHRNNPSSSTLMGQSFSPAVTYSDLGQHSTIWTDGGVAESYTQPHPTHPVLRKPPFPTMDETLAPPVARPARRPLESDSRTSLSDETTRRQTWQQELDSQLYAVEAQRRALTEGENGKPLEQTINPSSQDQEIRRMRDQMQVMSEQIQLLRNQRESERTQGLSEEPPPGYVSPF